MSPWSLRCCRSETQSWKQKPLLLLFWGSENGFEWKGLLVVDTGLLGGLVVTWAVKKNERVVWTRLV